MNKKLINDVNNFLCWCFEAQQRIVCLSDQKRKKRVPIFISSLSGDYFFYAS